VQRDPTSALLSWEAGTGTTRAFKIRKSAVPGDHPDPTTFPGGKLAAFTWTTDDGYDDNLLYEPVFSSRGLRFTAFLNPAYIGNAGRLTWADVAFLHQQGHEMANHTHTHTALVDDRAIALRHVGAAPCSLAVAGGRLRTWVSGVPDLDVLLTTPSVYFLSTLAGFLDADPDYEAVLLAAPDTLYATYSQFLDPVSGLHIGNGAPAETLTTARGVHDDAEMLWEIQTAQTALESHLLAVDPSYRCRTLGYPNHAHRQWAMSTLNELGYLGARSGGLGAQPYYSQGAYKIGFNTTYEAPLAAVSPANGWTESQTRSTIATRMATWKANREWAVLMKHHEGELDAQHVEWIVDTIAADPDVWIAPFDEVMEYLSSFAVDVGYPLDPLSGTCSARIHGLEPTETCYVVVTAYDAALSESGWSGEVVIGPHPAVGAPAVAASGALALRALPNPFSRVTTIEFSAGRAGPARAEVWNLAGRRVREIDLGWIAAGPARFDWDGRGDAAQRLGSGVYWVRVQAAETAGSGRVLLLR
jgi:peptidoglycan/xylan/chitin deacetylase (PgdA/CDA1 family)